ncbi:hypothetical protein VB005_02736 [Metarhizium brunneum]
MQCLMDNTAIIVENFDPGNETDPLKIIDEETKRCQDDAVRLYSRTDCQPEKLETECYFPIWVEYSKCVGNSPSTSRKGSDCPKDPSSKPEKVKGEKDKSEEAKPQEADPEEADECPEDPSSKPEKVKGEKAKPQGAKPQGAKPEKAKPQEPKPQGAKPEKAKPQEPKTQEPKPEKAKQA